MNTSNILYEYEILNIPQLIKLNNIVMMHKILKRRMKTNFKIDFSRNHQHNTRACSRPRLAAFRTNTGKNSIFRTCTEIYFNNSTNLPLVHNDDTFYKFKRKLKELLFNGGLS